MTAASAVCCRLSETDSHKAKFAHTDMAPKSPWNKKVTPHQNATKVAAVEHVASPAIDYASVQLEEIEALRAIFMEDFEEIEVKSAWSNSADRSFRLRLAAFSDSESSVKLSVRLTATYPKTVPMLEVSGLEAFHERTRRRVQNVLRTRPKELLGEVMIHAIATEIQEALEDAIQSRQQGSLPSLEDERASAEEVATALAKQAEEVESRRQQEAQEEEERVLKQMVDEELHRREKRKTNKPANSTAEKQRGPPNEVVTFDQSSRITSGNESAQFTEVSIVGREQSFLIGQPVVDTGTPPELVAIKRYNFNEKNREGLAELDTTLDSVRTLRHANVLTLFSFHIDKKGHR